MKIYICKPYWRHLLERFPTDIIHQIHFWTAGILLIEHKEPDGRMASDHHKEWILIPNKPSKT
jgi:hypothetical protein